MGTFNSLYWVPHFLIVILVFSLVVFQFPLLGSKDDEGADSGASSELSIPSIGFAVEKEKLVSTVKLNFQFPLLGSQTWKRML